MSNERPRLTVPDDLPRPTDGELVILRALWRRGEGTVRDLVELLEQQRPTAYTTVLKMLQIMHGKGLVVRDERRRTHVYYPAIKEPEMQRRLAGDLIDRAFDGSAGELVLRALDSRPPSRGELAEIRDLLATLEERDPDGTGEEG